MSERSDSDLISGFLAGNVACFEALMDRHKTSVFHTVFGLIGDSGAAEELTQDVFVKVYAKLERFRGDAKFSTWVYRIAQNTVFNYRVKHQLGRFISLDFLVDNHVQFATEAPSLELESQYQDQIRLLHEALSQLPFKWRQILVLREVNECSYEDIAQILHCSIGTVKSRLFRAKDKLKESYKFMEKGVKSHVRVTQSQAI